MKQVFKSIFIAVCFILALNDFSNNAQASVNSNKSDIFIVRTVESGIAYITIYTDSGIVLAKVAEL